MKIHWDGVLFMLLAVISTALVMFLILLFWVSWP
jgi:hypothetical protein